MQQHVMMNILKVNESRPCTNSSKSSGMTINNLA